MKVCQGEIYELYIDLNTRFKSNAFEAFTTLLNVKHDLDDEFEHGHITFGI